jgi:hypothetical protein
MKSALIFIRPSGRLLVIAFCAAILSPAHLARGQEKPTDLPLNRVVMFSSGVAFYEHSGKVQGDARVELRFNVRDVDDLLKSMVVQDLGGGRVSTVSYGSKDPITRTLKSFAIDLTTNPTLGQLLEQVRGEKVQISAPNPLEGTIIGVERRPIPVKDQEPIQAEYVNLLTADGLRAVPLDRIGSIKLLNEKLDAELRQALAILATGHDTDKKTVGLSFTGQGERAVRVGYVQEAPIWKTSYRLVLADDQKPHLQGWAIVENTTEQDWKDVHLTLVSGRPISFVMNLYDPLFVPRPRVEPELFASLRPQTYSQDLADAEEQFKRMAEGGRPLRELERLEKADADRAANGRFAGGFGAPKPSAPAPPGKSPAEPSDYRQGFQSAAQAADVGELFQYQIDTPVTLERRRSAMLPIVNGAVEAEKVSIYNPRVHAKHPLNGLQLTNTTGLHLMQGPITVFDDAAYAGDAQIQDLTPLSKRLVSYAIDLATEVAQEAKQEPELLVSVTIKKGVLESTRKYVRSLKSTIKNSSAKAKKVLIEHPKQAGWTLTAPKEPAETTRDLYRFAVTAEPGKPAELTIAEEHVASQSVAVNNLDDATIQYYLRATTVSDKVKQALREVIRRKTEIGLIVAERTRLEQKIAVIGQEQERIRQNMAQIDRNSDLYRRYVTKFSEQEDAIESLRTQILGLRDQEFANRKALDEYLLTLDLT